MTSRRLRTKRPFGRSTLKVFIKPLKHDSFAKSSCPLHMHSAGTNQGVSASGAARTETIHLHWPWDGQIALSLFHSPLNQQVYNAPIPIYKSCLPCQGVSGAFCHSNCWKASPARVYCYRASCSELVADGCVAHLTESRPSKDKEGGRICPKCGKSIPI